LRLPTVPHQHSTSQSREQGRHLTTKYSPCHIKATHDVRYRIATDVDSGPLTAVESFVIIARTAGTYYGQRSHQKWADADAHDAFPTCSTTATLRPMRPTPRLWAGHVQTDSLVQPGPTCRHRAT
jgi:hypothetical protein